MGMRIGSIVFATDQGLGILAKSFYDHGIITNVLIVKHSHYVTRKEWYPGAEVIPGRATHDVMKTVYAFCERMNGMLFFETPFFWETFDHCRKHKVRTALMPMYECMPKVLPAKPDMFLNPSELDQRYYPEGIHIPIPVEVKWRQRTEAKVFVHNAGHGGLKGRNGTGVLVDALRMVKSPITFILRSQTRIGWDMISFPPHVKVDVRVGNHDYDSLWEEGDVFVFPEAFNGLSLPLQEARAAGMLVITTDRFPMNRWLPNDPLIPVTGYVRNDNVHPRCNDFARAVVSPESIAQTIDRWYGKDITDYSLQGKAWAESMSWEKLKPRYMEVLSR